MGYTHYWTGPKNLDPTKFKAFSGDCAEIISECQKKGIEIGDGDGDGGFPEIGAELISFNGVGDNSHETFWISTERDNFDFCKTARKPYDLAATACLVALKKHFGEEFDISSDGGERGFADGKKLCQSLFGYGADMTIGKEENDDEKF